MEPHQILLTSTILMAITALGGIVMALIRFGGKPAPPSWLAMLHGLLAAAGLTLLAYACATMAVPGFAWWALLLFLAAAVGGVVLNFHFHLKQIPLPIWLVLVHAVVAVLAFVCLALAAFGRGG
ncbi:hypothetical protein [Massilia endophytica]|uniref:hypothetical protein n=1 Tax=Massilia endophytica TaxID=2899220 RepID=UPI001E4AD57B|nr:hypothetical protein [Massilia endophytica]UGQ48572.1 hypothetical protein LSQ66_08975 [Massilia endophytica]